MPSRWHARIEHVYAGWPVIWQQNRCGLWQAVPGRRHSASLRQHRQALQRRRIAECGSKLGRRQRRQRALQGFRLVQLRPAQGDGGIERILRAVAAAAAASRCGRRAVAGRAATAPRRLRRRPAIRVAAPPRAPPRRAAPLPPACAAGRRRTSAARSAAPAGSPAPAPAPPAASTARGTARPARRPTPSSTPKYRVAAIQPSRLAQRESRRRRAAARSSRNRGRAGSPRRRSTGSASPPAPSARRSASPAARSASSRSTPPQPRRSRRCSTIAMQPSSFGTSSSPMVPTNIHMARTGSITGHCGNSDLPGGEVVRRHEARLHRDQDAGEQEQQPQRRGDVGADAGQQMQPADPVQPARRQHRGVLQVALAPAPVAHREVGQRRRALPRSCRAAPGTMCTAQPPRRISAASTKSWLMIVAAERLAAAQFRQARPVRRRRACGSSRCGPSSCPPRRATRRCRARSAGRRPGRRIAACGRTAWSPPVMIGSVWISPTSGCALHRADQAHQRLAGHHAVGVEDQELRIGAAEARAPSRRCCRPCARCSSGGGDRRCAPRRRSARAAPGTPPPRRSRRPGRWCR